VTARVELLQAGRGIAAIAVVIAHANLYEPSSPLLWHGTLGVHFFFLLSGFIIYHANASRPFGLASYASSRARRIFLPYWPIGVFAAISYIWLGRDFSWASTLFLLPGQTALGPAWSLQHEIVFYVLAGFFFLSGSPLKWASAWAVVIISWNAISGPLPMAEQPLLSLINLEFVAGMFAARFIRLPDMRVGPVLNFLGDASYSIYLAHLPAMGILWRLGAPFPVVGIGGILSGIAYHILIERPVLSAGVRHHVRLGQRGQEALGRCVAAFRAAHSPRPLPEGPQ
jgi:peptidoglycan/LPS O-acetylase OafA/YrhL